ncbi:MAG TPA: serine/threonine-protein kinase [Dactylosporangium sp.]|nr:serine/threonine-protein kinase [Dactylosporangium sp.]
MDRYRLIEPLGIGGMSVVWRAFDKVLERAVAVKLLAPDLLADERFRTRIQAEARAAALLSHPHIAQVYDFGHDADGAPFVVMELVTGRPLEGAGPLPLSELLRVGADLSGALSAVHARGLVHRDIKPANVMLTEAGAKLVDFGISAVAGDESDRHDEILGTPAYVAPERLQGLPTTAATDVYALGVLLYQALAGRLPWPSVESSTGLLEAHCFVRPAPLPPGLCPPPVAQAIARCLAKSPQDRPSAEEMREVLSAAVPRASLALGAWMPRSRYGRLTLAGAVAAAAVSGLAMCAPGTPEEPTWMAAAATTESAAPADVDCAVQYSVRDGAGGAFAADLHLTATGGDGGWSLTFSLPAGQAIGALNGATWTQDGNQVSVRGSDLVADLSTGATFAVTGADRASSGQPSDFALNGSACRSVLLATTTTAAPPTVHDKHEKKEKPGKPGKKDDN